MSISNVNAIKRLGEKLSTVSAENNTAHTVSEAIDIITENLNINGGGTMDAYEQELKRLDIKTEGENCDKVSKFFETAESATLFPEFVSRSIKQGMSDTILSRIVAVKTVSSSTDTYTDFAISESDTDGTSVISVSEATTAITLDEYNRIISTPYETVMNQSIEAYAFTLRVVGKKLANEISEKAIDTLAYGSSSYAMAGAELAYEDILSVCEKISDNNFQIDTIIVSPSVAHDVFLLSEMQGCHFDSDGIVHFPFGASMLISPHVADNTVICIDSEYALEMITTADLGLETDKLIDKQLDSINVSVFAGFKKLMGNSIKLLKIV